MEDCLFTNEQSTQTCGIFVLILMEYVDIFDVLLSKQT